MRCMEQDIFVFQLLRQNQPRKAAMQLVRNMRSKHQVLLQGGSWDSAWLLTGQPDPVKRRPFAGTPTQMAVVAGYLGGMAELRKKVRDGGSDPMLSEEGEQGEEETTPMAKAKGKAKAKAKG